MNNLVERYIYDVVRRLKEEQREEVAMELGSHIDEMLSDNPSENEVEEVLQSLGHPRTLANEYRGNKTYLISPEWYEDYILVLKIVAIIFGSIAFISGLITNILNPEATTFIGIFAEVFGKTISNIFSALFSAFAIVTIIFAVIDRKFLEGHKFKFETKCLPNVPKEEKILINRKGAIATVVWLAIFGTVFLYLLMHSQLYFVWIQDGAFDNSVPLFTKSVVMAFIPLLIASFTLSLLLEIFKIFEGRWTNRLIITNTIVKIITCIISIIFLTQANLIDTAFINQVAEYFDILAADVSGYIKIVLMVFVILVIIGTLADIITVWFKSNNSIKKFFKNN